jgi:hypothetical protein
MLGAQGLWAGRDLYRATPAVTWDLVFFPVSSEGPPLLVASYNTRGDVEDLFQPGSSRGICKNVKREEIYKIGMHTKSIYLYICYILNNCT